MNIEKIVWMFVFLVVIISNIETLLINWLMLFQRVYRSRWKCSKLYNLMKIYENTCGNQVKIFKWYWIAPDFVFVQTFLIKFVNILLCYY